MVAHSSGAGAQEAAPPAQATSDVTVNPVDPTLIRELVGDWQNDLKSTLSIKSIDPATGRLDGTYRSPSGTPGQAFPVVGWINTKPAEAEKDNVIVVSFSARWGKIGSVTAWNGYYRLVGTVPRIVGQWNLSRANSDFEWDHIIAGQDRFTKLTPSPAGQ